MIAVRGRLRVPFFGQCFAMVCCNNSLAFFATRLLRAFGFVEHFRFSGGGQLMVSLRRLRRCERGFDRQPDRHGTGGTGLMFNVAPCAVAATGALVGV